MPDPKHALMRECLQLHFQIARSSFRRSMLLGLAIAVIGAAVMAVVGENVLFFFFGLVVVFVLTLPIPLAVHYVNVSRIRDLQKKLDQSPDVVAQVAAIGATARAAAGAVGLAVIYGGRQRVVVFTTGGAQYALWLPPDHAAQLAAAYR
jgi:hypothetical protein